MDFVLGQTVNGVVFGMLLFLLAAGLTLMLGTMSIVNLAQRSFYLLGDYVGYTIAQRTDNFFLACLGGPLAIAILGVVTYKAVLEQRFARKILAQVLLTFGMLLIIGDAYLWIWGWNPLAIPKPDILHGTIHPGSIVVSVYRLAVIIIGVLILLFLCADLTLERRTTKKRKGGIDHV